MAVSGSKNRNAVVHRENEKLKALIFPCRTQEGCKVDGKGYAGCAEDLNSLEHFHMLEVILRPLKAKVKIGKAF